MPLQTEHNEHVPVLTLWSIYALLSVKWPLPID